MTSFAQRIATTKQGYLMMLVSLMGVISRDAKAGSAVSEEDITALTDLIGDVLGYDTLEAWLIRACTFEPGVLGKDVYETVRAVRGHRATLGEGERTHLWFKLSTEFSEYVEASLEAYESKYHISVQVTQDGRIVQINYED